MILILGGPRFATLEVEIYRQAVNYFNLELAVALSLIQLGFTFIVMAVYTRLSRERPCLSIRARSLLPPGVLIRGANGSSWARPTPS